MSSSALVVEIDQFDIVKNGSSLFSDSFSNNLTPSQEAGYGVFGAFPNGVETGGLLTLDSDWGGLGSNAAGQARRTLGVIRQTNINPSFPTNGLTRDDTIEVSAIFNLVAPPGSLTKGYGIQVQEAELGEPLRLLVELDVQYNAAVGGDVIRYLRQDFVSNSITTLGAVPLAIPPGADQIMLVISRPDVSNGDFYGAYAFGTGGVFDAPSAFATPGSLFAIDDFVRGRFIDFTALPAPEPTTLALLGVGLAALGATRRRK
jgi:hypothetical protein